MLAIDTFSGVHSNANTGCRAARLSVLQRTAVTIPLQLDRAASIALQDQLYEQLRQLILTGRLKPNTRIIATRFLAEQVGVSRRTVLFAYERLIAEGYLETRPAIGTYVSPTPPEHRKSNAAGSPTDMQRQPSTIRGEARTGVSGSFIDFSPLQSDSSRLLPPKVWLHWIREAMASDPEVLAQPVPAGGLEALCRVIADYLAATRGILASPDQVVVVNGRRHACSLVAHLYQHRNDPVIVEAPGNKDIARIFEANGAEAIGVPVDEFGLQTDLLPRGRAALAYVTPSRQDPTGGVMPQTRRAALIEWARNAGAYIIEDDSDADLRYFGSALPPLVALDPYGLTFYLGSFTSRLGSGLSLGYLLAPAEFASAVIALKSMGMEAGQLVEQMVLANLLASGDYDHHLRRLRKAYLEQRDALIQALKSCFGTIKLVGAEAGTQLTWLLPEGAPSAMELRDAVEVHGVKVECVGGDDAKASPFYDRALIFGYAALKPDSARRGVTILADVYKRLSASGRYDTT